MDIDNESDYKEMVHKIVDIISDSGMTKILIDMKNVEKLPLHQADGNSEDDESGASDENQVFSFIKMARCSNNVIFE